MKFTKVVIWVCLVAIFSISLVSCQSRSSSGNQVDPTPSDIAPSEEEISPATKVTLEEGAAFEQEGWPSINIPPGAVASDAILEVSKLDNWEQTGDDSTTQVVSVYEFSLEGGNFHEAVEVALPVDLSDEQLEYGETTVGYFDEDQGWIALPSWYSDDDGMVHAITDHFSIFGVLYSKIPVRPRITLKSATPNPFQGVGYPPCLDQDLKVEVNAEDPNGTVEKVEVSISFNNFSTKMMTEMVKETQNQFAMGLTIASGGITGILPFAQGVTTVAEMEDPGLIATGWESIKKDEETGLFTASIDLSSISACKFDVDAVMKASGLEKIVVKIKVTDDSGLTREDRIEIPVYSQELPYAELRSPGGVDDDIQNPSPIFEWNIYNPTATVDFEQEVVFAKGDLLWGRRFGVTREEVEWSKGSWQPEYDLDPGDYVWGVEVENEEGIVTHSELHYFTIPKLWSELEIDGHSIEREDVQGNYKALSWEVYRDGNMELSRLADNEMVLDLDEIFRDDLPGGSYTVWLEATTENFLTGERTSRKISNVVEFITVVEPEEPEDPYIIIEENSNCREGPSQLYPEVAILSPGEKHVILRYSPDGEWFFVRNPPGPVKKCWIWGGLGNVVGDVTGSVSVKVPPPPPRPDGSIGDLSVSQRNITLSIRDSASVDGDRIRVKLNGNVILKDYKITADWKAVNVNLLPGDNIITVKALNEGSSSPNTVEVKVNYVVYGTPIQVSGGLYTGQEESFSIFAP